MISITRSKFKYTTSKPPRISKRRAMLPRRHFVRRCRTCFWCAINSRKTSPIGITRGAPFESITLKFMLKRYSKSVNANRCAIILSAGMLRVFGVITMRTSVVDSSMISSTSGNFLESIRVAICSTNLDFIIPYGISDITTCQPPRSRFSISQRARTRNAPRPVS